MVILNIIQDYERGWKHIIDEISYKIANYFYTKNIIDEKVIPIYKYGMQVLISNVMASTIVVSIGVLISKLLESIIFILLYSTLRIYTGGYHAKTSLSCNIVFSLAFIMTLVQE